MTAAPAAAAAAASAARMAVWAGAAGGGWREGACGWARVPALRAPDHVLVRVQVAGLNPIDAAMLDGYGHRALGLLRTLEGAPHAADGRALVPARDALGTVVRAGPAARAAVGQRVWLALPPHWPGALAQYVLLRDAWAAPAPRALGHAAGGALYAALSATAVLRAAGLPAGTQAPRGARVLLLGLGGAGQAALQLLTADGAEVFVGCSPDLAPLARELGAAAVLDRYDLDYGRHLEEAGPYAAIVDCAGLGGREAGARKWRFGRYATLTSPVLRETDAAGAWGVARAAAELVVQCAATARAARAAGAGGPPPLVCWAFFSPRADDIALLGRRAEAGQFRVSVEGEYGWREAGAAFARLERGHARGKLLLHVD